MAALLTPVRSDAPAARANPVAKLGASVAVTVVLLLSVDVVSAGVALVLEVALLPWCGLGPRDLLRRLTPILLAAASAGFATAWFGEDSGRVLLGGGLFSVSEGSLVTAAAIVLRVLAVGVPGVVLLATTDPTDLADALAQRLHLPHRFVLGALAALRLMGLLVEEWRTLALARRARGVGDGDGIAGSLRVLGGQAFALLVLAVRRAGRLALAMEARGFGGTGPRTWARPSTFGALDVAVLGIGVGIATVSVTASVLTGAWDFVLA